MARLLVLIFALIVGVFTPAFAERRVAFVAGINDYPNLPREQQLERAVKDAETIGDTLQTLGFRVTRVTREATQEVFLDRFREFVRSIKPGDTALFFFAGHGISLDGTNYLIPSDIPAFASDNELLMRSRSLAETDLIADIRKRGARVTVMVIDACRDNPFPKAGTRSLGAERGLTIREPAEGVFSIYSAGFGQKAFDRLPGDDLSPNSVFTRVFAEELKKPGVNLIDLGETVREEVVRLVKGLKHKQVPAVYNQIVGAREVFLAGLAPVPPQVPAAPAPDEMMWSFIERTAGRQQIEDLIRRFPQSKLRPVWEARLTEEPKPPVAAALPPSASVPAAEAVRPAVIAPPSSQPLQPFIIPPPKVPPSQPAAVRPSSEPTAQPEPSQPKPLKQFRVQNQAPLIVEPRPAHRPNSAPKATGNCFVFNGERVCQ